ncbi:MAG: hypothetical protein J0L74_11195, partial [Burkholderiales bacterium]|nr:hypothetical protein [Burkholderiales bacterium]
FFNDYREEPFPGETRENPPSPKVKTYDMKPEMSAEEIRDAVLHVIRFAYTQTKNRCPRRPAFSYSATSHQPGDHA